MLDAKTVDWLECRKSPEGPAPCARNWPKRDLTKEDCQYCSMYETRNVKYCPMASDFRDAARFNELVARAAAQGESFLRPQGCSWWEGGERKTNCPPGFDIDNCAGVSSCNLYRAGIKAEEEME